MFAHVHASVIDQANLYVDAQALDAVGRMGGNAYASTRDRFDLATMSVERWRADGKQANIRRP